VKASGGIDSMIIAIHGTVTYLLNRASSLVTADRSMIYQPIHGHHPLNNYPPIVGMTVGVLVGARVGAIVGAGSMTDRGRHQILDISSFESSSCRDA